MDKETMDNNVIIDKFMGEYNSFQEDSDYMIALSSHDTSDYFYSSSYKLLFPVLIKIESLGHKWSVGVSEYPYHYCHIGDIKIEAVSALDAIYGACVEFIKNYNNKQFVTYEIAMMLKELGFDEECFGVYSENKVLFSSQLHLADYLYRVGAAANIKAPLWQQAIDWIFKKLDFYYPYLKIEIFSDGSGAWYQPKDEGNDKLEIDFNNLEEALEIALQEALKLIK